MFFDGIFWVSHLTHLSWEFIFVSLSNGIRGSSCETFLIWFFCAFHGLQFLMIYHSVHYCSSYLSVWQTKRGLREWEGSWVSIWRGICLFFLTAALQPFGSDPIFPLFICLCMSGVFKCPWIKIHKDTPSPLSSGVQQGARTPWLLQRLHHWGRSST